MVDKIKAHLDTKDQIIEITVITKGNSRHKGTDKSSILKKIRETSIRKVTMRSFISKTRLISSEGKVETTKTEIGTKILQKPSFN